MPIDMEKANAQSEFYTVRNLEIPATANPLHYMNAPFIHDIVTNEGCLYAAYVKVQGFEYGIIHVFLTLRASISPGMQIDMGTHTSPL